MIESVPMSLKKVKQKSMVMVLTGLVCLFPLSVSAQKLPSMDEDPWLGYFSGHVQRGFEFGVGCSVRVHVWMILAGHLAVSAFDIISRCGFGHAKCLVMGCVSHVFAHFVLS